LYNTPLFRWLKNTGSYFQTHVNFKQYLPIINGMTALSHLLTVASPIVEIGWTGDVNILSFQSLQRSSGFVTDGQRLIIHLLNVFGIPNQLHCLHPGVPANSHIQVDYFLISPSSMQIPGQYSKECPQTVRQRPFSSR
jgi:hypothetical protein